MKTMADHDVDLGLRGRSNYPSVDALLDGSGRSVDCTSLHLELDTSLTSSTSRDHAISDDFF